LKIKNQFWEIQYWKEEKEKKRGAKVVKRVKYKGWPA